MTLNRIPISVLTLFILLLITGCGSDTQDLQSGCPDEELLTRFNNEEQREIFIYNDGGVYSAEEETCRFLLQYFDPGFLETHYKQENGKWFLTDGSNVFPTRNTYFENFESGLSFTELFIRSYMDTHLYWDSFTLQSRATPTVPEYNALRQCILEKSCDFIDHSIELVADPVDPDNTVMQFKSLAPVQGMVTSKTSLSSSLHFFRKGDELWFEARYFFKEGIPFSIVDFENGYFEQQPGPRVVIRDLKLEMENKFGEKLNFTNNSDITLPLDRWLTVKVQLRFSDTADGLIRIWQDGVLVLDTQGINLPTSNSLQNILEIGITASQEATVLLLDDIRISDAPF